MLTRKLLILLPAIILAAYSRPQAQSFSQLAGSAGGAEQSFAVPEPVPGPADGLAAEGTDPDFLVRPEAEHEPGAALFFPGRQSEKAAGGAPRIPYLEIARAEAGAQGMDLALVLAVIQKESSFDPKARSSVGASGLMQLMPDTARHMGLKDMSQLTKPAVNIKYGVKYLKFLWDEFAEAAPADLSVADIEAQASQMAIAAYNAGQGNVRKYNGVPPFRETRNYVVKVTQYFKQYEGLLAELALETRP